VTILLCDILFAIQKNLDVLSRKFYAQRLPLVPRNGRIKVADGDLQIWVEKNGKCNEMQTPLCRRKILEWLC
jgi:hypothetical protein